MNTRSAAVERATAGTAFFDTQAKRWIGLYDSKASFKDRLNLFTSALASAVPPPARVLDFGCGPGVIALALAERGYEVVGVDGAPRMIDLARAEAVRRRIACARFEVARAHELGTSFGGFDAIVCSSVIEYIAEDARLLTELAGALRVGGCLLISVPHTGSVFGRLEDALRWLKVYTGNVRHGHLSYSLRRYRLDAFGRTLAAAGLSAAAVTYFETPVPGRLGVAMSRLRRLGVMALVTARKDRAA